MINILVVDDEKEQNQVICTYLMKNNIHAVGCTSAAQAYDVLFEGHFDLIISDIMMPEIDGYEFAESIRRIDKTSRCSSSAPGMTFSPRSAVFVSTSMITWSNRSTWMNCCCGSMPCCGGRTSPTAKSCTSMS